MEMHIRFKELFSELNSKSLSDFNKFVLVKFWDSKLCFNYYVQLVIYHNPVGFH